MADEYVYKISSRYLQKWLRWQIWKHVRRQPYQYRLDTIVSSIHLGKLQGAI